MLDGLGVDDVVVLCGLQHFEPSFQPQPLLHWGGGWSGWWGTQQFLPEFHSQLDGHEEPLGGEGGLGVPPWGRQQDFGLQLLAFNQRSPAAGVRKCVRTTSGSPGSRWKTTWWEREWCASK